MERKSSYSRARNTQVGSPMAMSVNSLLYPDSVDKQSLESGHQYQDFVVPRLMEIGVMVQTFSSTARQFGAGESRQGVEIKLDSRFAETKRLSIETAEKTRAENARWIPSGIYRNDNSWLYVQGDYNVIFVFAKSTLRFMHRMLRLTEGETPTVQKFYLPLVMAQDFAAKVIWMTDKEAFWKKVITRRDAPDVE